MEFKQRTTAPHKDDRKFGADNPFAYCGYPMPNCTTYAYGRAWEIMGSKPKLSLGNAENWYDYPDGYQRGQSPMVGAIACWRRGKAGNASDGAGHVAVVEQINRDGSIITSESGWKAAGYWWRKTRCKGDGRWGQSSEYTFQGFIYLPVAAVQEAAPAKITGLPVLRAGAGGDSVKALQALLTGYGYTLGNVDGEFGSKTKSALTSYQKDHGLDPDGVCGPATWAKLLGMR